MTINSTSLHDQGFLITPPLIEATECDAIAKALNTVPLELAGTRNALLLPWCTNLSRQLRIHQLLSTLFTPNAVAVQCTMFEKSIDRNWLVPVHQDLSIPVARKVEHPQLSGWSKKEGVFYVQAPIAVLEQLLIVRLHIDECTLLDGPLVVVPESHRLGRVEQASESAIRHKNGEVQCAVSRGGALVMRPLLLHASSKARAKSLRRVLHFVFGPPSLPFGLTWHHAV